MFIARKNLSQSDYVDAAVRFANENGMEAMTMRSLGEAMGVDATAVYRHFPTKEKLLEAMVDWFFGVVIEDVRKNAENKSPRERCVSFAQSFRNTFETYPNIGGQVSYSSGSSPNGYMSTKMVIDALQEMGLSGKDLVVSYQGLEGLVLGSCLQDFIGAPNNWEIRRTRYRLLDHPAFDEVAIKSQSVKETADKAFNSALSILLDKCETLVK